MAVEGDTREAMSLGIGVGGRWGQAAVWGSGGGGEGGTGRCGGEDVLREGRGGLWVWAEEDGCGRGEISAATEDAAAANGATGHVVGVRAAP